MILLVDNYDSFTYNLAHLFGELGAEVVVRRNDEISVEELRARYRAVGAQVDRLERKRGSGAARPLRERYLAIPYFDAVRVESLRRDVYRKLADISRDARRALDR